MSKEVEKISTTALASLKAERKKAIEDGTAPDWYTSGGFQLFKDAYQYEGETVKGCFQRVAREAALQLPDRLTDTAYLKFFNLLWNGWLAGSTPVLANTGTNRGESVSCSGGDIQDSVYGMGASRLEMECLTKNGFGTSYNLTNIRPRGAAISAGGKASGVLPVINGLIQSAKDISQGNRRGAVSYYVDFESDDFYEVLKNVKENPDSNNIGWVFFRDAINRLEAGDPELNERWMDIMELKRLTGRGYFFKIDTVNDLSPDMYKNRGLVVKASNLCTEITLFSDADHTFTCVLSSMNLAKYDEWKGTDAVFWATIFLDCMAELFIKSGREKEGLEKAVRFTEKGRALGLGTLGFHTYLQDRSISMDSLEAVYANGEIFKHLNKESLRASEWMAKELGEPEWCEGYGVRNTHRLAIAPNTSSSLLCGGVSQGIEPVVAAVYNQPTSAGEIQRINPSFLALAKSKGMWETEDQQEEVTDSIIEHFGSVQQFEWLTDHEKRVFLTAYEIDQNVIIRLAAQRQPHICQAQSINLFFSAEEEEEVIQEIVQAAMLNDWIKTLYYMRALAGIQAAKSTCVVCEG